METLAPHGFTGKIPLAHILHTPIESPTERRVRAPGLQAPNSRRCKPGALTRRLECKISGLGVYALGGAAFVLTLDLRFRACFGFRAAATERLSISGLRCL